MTADAPRVTRPGRRVRARRVAAAFAAFIVAWGVAVAVAGLVARSDRGCVSACHAKAGLARAHTSSSHAGVTCAACHSAQGATGVIADGLAMQRMFVGAVSGVDAIAQPLASDVSCRRCHARALKLTVESRGIAVRHADFADVSCLQCHGGTGHRRPQRVYGRTQMQDCTSCHKSGAEDTDACDRCHVDAGELDPAQAQTVWRATHGPEWESTHGAGDLSSCSSCHPRAYCADCHGTPIPHSSRWPVEHGKRLNAARRAACLRCHEAQWCADCHGVPIPHPTGFLALHGEMTARVGEPVCTACHTKTACDECHLRSSHPQIPGVDFAHKVGR